MLLNYNIFANKRNRAGGIQVATPVITETAGVISIACATVGASIYYTTDGSTPNATDTLYEGTFTPAGGVTVKAIGIKADYNSSIVAEFDYLYEPETYAYIARVEADGGTVNLAVLNTDIAKLKELECFTGEDAVSLWYSTRHCLRYRQDSSVDKMYELKGLDVTNASVTLTDLPVIDVDGNLQFTYQSGRVTSLTRTSFDAPLTHPLAGKDSDTAEYTAFLVSDNGKFLYSFSNQTPHFNRANRFAYGFKVAHGNYKSNLSVAADKMLRTYMKTNGEVGDAGDPHLINIKNSYLGAMVDRAVTSQSNKTSGTADIVDSAINIGVSSTNNHGTSKFRDLIIFNKVLTIDQQTAISNYLLTRGL